MFTVATGSLRGDAGPGTAEELGYGSYALIVPQKVHGRLGNLTLSKVCHFRLFFWPGKAYPTSFSVPCLTGGRMTTAWT